MIKLLHLVTLLSGVCGAQKKHSHKKPRFTSTLNNLTISVGENGVFECSAVGTPEPEMIINNIDDGVEGLVFPKKHIDIAGEKTIKKDFVNVTKENQGWYRCYALNQKQLVFHDAYLTVVDKQCKYCDGTNVCVDGICPCHIDVPTIKLKTRNIKVIFGDSFVLSAKVFGAPTPEVSWYKKGRNGDTKVGSGESLEISTNQDVDGIYYAVAVNCVNNKISSDTINVLIEPETEDPNELNEIIEIPDMPSNPKICNIVGAAHFTTFDGWRYEFRGKCSYVLSMDCEYAQWYIYGRYMTCDTGYCLESTTIFYGNNSIQLLRGWVINYMGVKYKFKENVPFKIDIVVITFDGLMLKLYFTDTVVIWDGYAGVQIVVSKGFITCGLCGNNDDTRSNDVDQVRQSRVQSIDDAQMRFIDSWKVDPKGKCSVPQQQKATLSWSCTRDQDRKAEYRQCRKMYSVASFQRCNRQRIANLRSFYDVCLADACYGEIPLVGYSKGCYAAQALASQCTIAGSAIEDEWIVRMGCSSRGERQADIIKVGCPQDKLPFA